MKPHNKHAAANIKTGGYGEDTKLDRLCGSGLMSSGGLCTVGVWPSPRRGRLAGASGVRAVMTLQGYRVLLLGQHTYRPGHVGTRAPVRLGIRVGVQSNPSLTMPPQGRGIRRGGHHLLGCFDGIIRVSHTSA